MCTQKEAGTEGDKEKSIRGWEGNDELFDVFERNIDEINILQKYWAGFGGG